MAERRGIWIISDEAYEDVVFDGAAHVSPASLPGMYDRTISLYTFSKTYAMTGLRLGYVAAKDATLRDRMKKALFYTASNVASVVQFGGVGALEGSQDARRRVPHRAAGAARSVLRGDPRARGRRLHRHSRRPARSTRSCEINPEWTRRPGATEGLALVGDDRVPDLAGTDRLRARRGLRRERRGLPALLLRARPARNCTGALESLMREHCFHRSSEVRSRLAGAEERGEISDETRTAPWRRPPAVVS